MSQNIATAIKRNSKMINPEDYLQPGTDLGVALPKKCNIFVKDWDNYIFLEKSPEKQNKGYKCPRESIPDFPPNSGTYELTDDPASPVVLICPAQNKILQSYAIRFGACASGPCLTPSRGVELLITNIIYNPNIRWIITAGKDSAHLSGDVIRCLVEHGIDLGTKRVRNTKCPTFPYLKNLPPELIERFREQVKVIDLLNCNDPYIIGLIIRLCIQEPKNAFKAEIPQKGQNLKLYDPGAYSPEGVLFNYSVMEMSEGFVDSPSPVGTTLHCLSVTQAYKELQRHIFGHGSWVAQESTRHVLDIISTQAIIYDVYHDLVPDEYYPTGWTTSSELTQDYLDKYATWLYLFPFTDVRFDTEIKKTVPFIPEKENHEYSYGTRTTAYRVELASLKEKEDIMELVRQYQERFYHKTPSNSHILQFYTQLEEVQNQSFNSLMAMAKGTVSNIKDKVTGSYRIYGQGQIPNIDLPSISTHFQLQIPDMDLKGKPEQMHNPCFCLYELYPRKLNYGEVVRGQHVLRLPLPALIDAKDYFPEDAKLKYGWLLYPCFFLRAHDILAFPSNASGGIKVANFISYYIQHESGENVPIGAYTHHAGSLHICDYAIPKQTLKAIQ
jgi:tetrahydromethanopterin S-methyltransferase subunit A